MAEIPNSLTEAEAQPGAHIVHRKHGWHATIVRAKWPAVVVLFESDLRRGRREERIVRGEVFGLLGTKDTPDQA
jgi:hypothetical protein